MNVKKEKDANAKSEKGINIINKKWGNIMAISYVNTNELDTIGAEIISLTGELETEISSLYNRLGNVPMTTREWVGEKAEFYFRKIGEDKQKYLDFVSKIKEVGYMLRDNSMFIQSTIKDNISNEAG